MIEEHDKGAGVVVRVKLVIADVDGTLTVRRGSLLIDVEAIEAIRLLERSGVKVALISGNSLPVTRALAIYLGATGPVAAENGCVGYANGEIHHLTDKKVPEKLVEELRKLGLRESWQNPYRYHDVAFINDGKVDISDVDKIVSRFKGFRVVASGYAFHVMPEECGKGAAAKWISRVTNVNLSEALSIGDGENDIEMLKLTAWSAAPSDADESVKNTVKIVASKPGGRGFAEIARLILSEKL
jgi:hypothetical protein